MPDQKTLGAPIRDLPMILPREGEIDDHSYLAAQWEKGPLARDRIGLIYSFPHAHWAVLFDDRFTRQIETEGIRLRGINEGPVFDFFANSLLTSNNPAHRARRTPLARTFAFPMMKALRPTVAATAETLIAPLAGAETVDLLSEVAGPMPAFIIARILGVPETDVPLFTRLVYSAIRALGARSESVIRDASEDMGLLTDYVGNLLSVRRAHPADDFLTEFLAAVEDGPLSEEEIRITVVTLIVGGSDTTRATMAITLARLLQNPDQWALFKSDPERWKGSVVEEGLRFDPVVGSLGRIAVEEFELAGTRIVPGTILSPSVLTALRDPDVYASPDRFDITRTDHLRYAPGFGSGAHRCLGEALARIELEEALAAFARFWPDAQLVGLPPRMRGISGTRGISDMMVAPGG